jgi:lipoprotein-anchoring transpeptidase ErfK/SrfK
MKLAAAVLLVSTTLASSQQPAPKLSRDQVVSLQITLDDEGFSCGQIDGKWGGLSQQALAAWQTGHGLKPTGEFDEPTMLVFPAAGPSYTNCVITTNDIAQLTPTPEDWLERSKLKAMWYGTVLEMIAERSHASEGLIRTLNPSITNWSDVTAGQTIILLRHTSEKPGKAGRLRVNLSGKTVTVFGEGDKVIALFPCSIAADKEKRPVGQLTVQTAAVNPNYTFDPVNFPELDEKQKAYGKLIIPAGPKNPVGAAWIGLSRTGYGLHGTPHPDQIGKTFSHGCFRLANWNATRLAQMVVIGMPVEVVE